MSDLTVKVEPSDTLTCSICWSEYTGWGNNAWPINEGRCCDGCNGLVLLERLARMNLPIKALKLGKTASALLKRGN